MLMTMLRSCDWLTGEPDDEDVQRGARYLELLEHLLVLPVAQFGALAS